MRGEREREKRLDLICKGGCVHPRCACVGVIGAVRLMEERCRRNSVD